MDHDGIDDLIAAEHARHTQGMDGDFRGYVVVSMKKTGDEMGCILARNLMSTTETLGADELIVFVQCVCVAAPERPGFRTDVARLDAEFRALCECAPAVIARRLETVAAIARRFPPEFSLNTLEA
jgi:hypothetical protein